MLKNPKAEWPDRMLVHHVGRWSKHAKCSIQNSRFTPVNSEEFYDLKTDPCETKNVIAEHPEIVAKLRAAYDRWWEQVQPFLVNEEVFGPKMNPTSGRGQTYTFHKGRIAVRS